VISVLEIFKLLVAEGHTAVYRDAYFLANAIVYNKYNVTEKILTCHCHLCGRRDKNRPVQLVTSAYELLNLLIRQRYEEAYNDTFIVTIIADGGDDCYLGLLDIFSNYMVAFRPYRKFHRFKKAVLTLLNSLVEQKYTTSFDFAFVKAKKAIMSKSHETCAREILYNLGQVGYNSSYEQAKQVVRSQKRSICRL